MFAPSPDIFADAASDTSEISSIARAAIAEWLARPPNKRMVPGSNPARATQGSLHLKDPLGSFEKSRGISPVPGFNLSIAEVGVASPRNPLGS